MLTRRRRLETDQDESIQPPTKRRKLESQSEEPSVERLEDPLVRCLEDLSERDEEQLEEGGTQPPSEDGQKRHWKHFDISQEMLHAYNLDLQEVMKISDDELEESTIGSDVWTSWEKKTFFKALSRHSSWRMDNIVADLKGGKTIGQCQNYLSILKEAGDAEGLDIDHPVARELSPSWIEFEERLSFEQGKAALEALLPTFSLTELCTQRVSASASTSRTPSRASSPGSQQVLKTKPRKRNTWSFRSRVDALLDKEEYLKHKITETESKAIYDAVVWQRRKAGETKALEEIDNIVKKIIEGREEIQDGQSIVGGDAESVRSLSACDHVEPQMALKQAMDIFFLGKIAALIDRVLTRTLVTQPSFEALTDDPSITISVIELLYFELRSFVRRCLKELAIDSSWSKDTAEYETFITPDAMRAALSNIHHLTQHQTMQDLKRSIGVRPVRYWKTEKLLSDDDASGSNTNRSTQEEDPYFFENHVDPMDLSRVVDIFSWDPPHFITDSPSTDSSEDPHVRSFGYRSPSLERTDSELSTDSIEGNERDARLEDADRQEDLEFYAQLKAKILNHQ